MLQEQAARARPMPKARVDVLLCRRRIGVVQVSRSQIPSTKTTTSGWHRARRELRRRASGGLAECKASQPIRVAAGEVKKGVGKKDW